MSAAETLWGVGTWVDADGVRRPWEVSHSEIQRAMGNASGVLGELGIGAGQRVLWCSMLSEAAQFWPFIVGTMLSGAQLSCSDATEAEAPRVAMFCRLIEYRAALGITGAILDGLDELGLAYGDVFGAIDVLGARPDAYHRLEAAGLAPQHFALAGPAVAVAREPGGPALVDADEWSVDLVDGRAAVTGRAEHATRFERAATNVGATSASSNQIVCQ
jgi:hypothetical protein